MTASRTHLTVVEVTPGPDGVHRVYHQLQESEESGNPFAPVPAVSRYFPVAVVDSIRRALALELPVHPDTQVVLTTSGSTGSPRGVEFARDHLTALNRFINSGEVVGQSFTEPPQWVSALPVTSAGGFNVLSRALHAGRPPLVLESVAGAGSFTADEVARTLSQHDQGPLMISLVPAQLRRLLGTEDGTDTLRRFALVLVGGSAAPISDRIRARDEGITAVFTYGMTETTGGCVFNGVPAPGVSVEMDGTLRIRGPVVATGYRPTTDAPAQLFGGRFTTADMGEITSEGSVLITGRVDDIVIINGVNISLFAIKNIIDAHPQVHDSWVLPDLTALVVVEQSATVPEDQLRTQISENLGTLALPRFISVRALPYLPNGKVDRQGIMQLPELAHLPRTPYG
ncbi:MAG: AMP-binding protein [Candidatus Nanopelagicales bacterium]|nr:AMP-binding protein [Candidatus Nanopelagicales bacterium]